MGWRKKLSFGWALVKARALGEIRPLFVQISVTNRCNARCHYCDYRERYSEELSTEELFHIIDQLAELGTKRIFLWGGEPLVRNDIGRIINYIRQKGIHCGLNTNGYLVPQKIEEIKNLNQITLSIDGDKKAHDANREPGSYDKAIEAVKVVRAAGIPLYTCVPLTKYNVSDYQIDYMLDEAEKYGYSVGIIILKHPTEILRNAWKYMASDDQVRHALRKVIREKKKGRPTHFSTLSYCDSLAWPDYSIQRIMADEDIKTITDSRNVRGPKCWAGRLSFLIDTNGDVYPCAASTVATMRHINALDVGVKRALEYVSKHNCQACFTPCRIEYNYLLSLNPRVLLNLARSYYETGY
ncbi:MAG: hypothetical protein AMS15_00915 [Planctomycetes bacterium DG_23]|nr:MAG: hypothetical protein AMS15_00915 [Planctomycetes bacterium DG_23]